MYAMHGFNAYLEYQFVNASWFCHFRSAREYPLGWDNRVGLCRCLPPVPISALVLAQLDRSTVKISLPRPSLSRLQVKRRSLDPPTIEAAGI